MKRNSFLLFFLCFFISAFSQRSIQLKNGPVKADDNINDAFIRNYNTLLQKAGGRSWVMLQFKKNPSAADRKMLLAEGIELLEYIPGNVFTVSLTKPLNTQFLKTRGITSVINITADQKIDPRLLNLPVNNATTEVLVLFFQTALMNEVTNSLAQEGFLVTSSDNSAYHVLQVQIPSGKLWSLAALPFVEYIEPLPPPAKELNFNSRNSTRANLLNTGLPGDYHLTGEGVTIGIGEVAYMQAHIDFKDRLINAAGYFNPASNYHSTHVHGIVGGAGLVDERYAGYAPKARMIPLGASSTISVASQPSNYALGMTLSNNSYVSGASCSNSVYSILAFTVDRQAIDVNFLQHVFGGGNSGEEQCAGYPAGFNTILSNYHSAKSTLSVGSTSSTGELAFYSSRGPAGGGRIKPEIVATGSSVISTIPNDGYGFNTGTSMSSPAVAGGLALLYQRYRQLHSGSNPRNSLMKAIICNTAKDLGNPGPDYSYGFGYMNLLRAVKAIDNTDYALDSITDQAIKNYNITIPDGTAQLKVMLYWPDPPASLLSPKALVNDLDLLLITPNSSTVLPYILDTVPANVANPATRGEDHINNMEQVVIDNPVPGNYTIKIRGATVAQNPLQDYVVTWDKVPDDIQLTFPNGGEGLAPGETITIQWDSWGHNSSQFHLEYSGDNGVTWQTINAAVAAGLRQYDWQVPVTATNKAMIRLTRNADGKTSTSKSFVIVGVPALSLSPVQCPEYIAIDWTAVTGATDYEVMMVRNGEMIVTDSTVATHYVFRNLSVDSVYWFTVRPRIERKHGRRSFAISRKPDSGTCAGTISDNDLKTEAIVYPLFGRKLTSNSLTNTENIRVRIRNMDDQPVNDFSVQYAVNNGSWVTETPGITIPAGAITDYSFLTPFDFSGIGDYMIRLVVKKTGDGNTNNDTITHLLRHVDNQPVNLNTALTETFEQADAATYNNSFWALRGATRFDYLRNSGAGSLMIMPAAVSDSNGKGARLFPSGEQELIATFNLSNYDTTTNTIGLEFAYSKPTFFQPVNDRVWIRGSDSSPWVELMNLDPGNNGIFTNKFISLQTRETLRLAQQNFSSSFQVKWTEHSPDNQYGFDNIRLFDASHDAELVSIDSFNSKNCALAAALPVRITVANHSKFTLVNLPVRYKIDGGAVQSGIIPSVPGNSVLPFTFPVTANLSAAGYHTIEAWTALDADSYTENDHRTIIIRNQLAITVFPYLQDFENGDGNWYTEGGANNSWQLGTPASPKIKGAASGTKAWKTNLSGNYNNLELSYLYSPCFDISALTNPTISISHAMSIDSCNFCDALTFQFSTNGKDWKNAIATPLSGYNWPVLMKRESYTRWHVATSSLSDTMGLVQFRFWFRSDFMNTKEGIAIDDIHIYDSTAAINDVVTNSTVIEQPINGGNAWIDFKDNGKLIASVQPLGQNMGLTKVQAFLQNGSPNFHGQYHLKRSFNIRPANALNDSVAVRLYFLDTETDSLLFANSCPSCFKPPHAYRFGLSQYSSAKETEINGVVTDDIKGKWKFINPAAIKTVPFQKGYYIEFKTKEPAEFWLNSGGYNNNSFLPTDINSFSATWVPGNNALIKWTTASEINIQRFEIEVAKGNEAYQQDNYSKTGEVLSAGPLATQQLYNYTDATAGKEGVYYYRVKVIDMYGNYSYSTSFPVVFTNELDWHFEPNLSTGLFHLVYQVNNGEPVQLQLFNSTGSLIKKEQFSGNGFVTRRLIDLQNTTYAGGVYLVRVQTKNQTKTFRIVKQ